VLSKLGGSGPAWHPISRTNGDQIFRSMADIYSGCLPGLQMVLDQFQAFSE
jgi:hypothetical protein